MPPPPWQNDDYQEWGEIRDFNTERIRTVYQLGSNTLNVLDLAGNQGYFWLRNSDQVPFGEIGAPLRIIFRLWLGSRGVHLLHAGAVGTSNGGVLLAGRERAGKSTTALACMDSELSYASDDYCLLGCEETPTIFSIYSTGKKEAGDIHRLPFPASAIANRSRLDTEKALYLLYEHYPEKIITSFPLRAVLITRVTNKKETTAEAAAPAKGLTALAPSTIFQLPRSGGETFQAMGRMVKQIPCYYLNLGTEMAQIPEVISDLISRHNR